MIFAVSTRRPMGTEREVPNPCSGHYVDHFARYHFAMGWVMGKTVLDVGCGTGYGADAMARAARRVVGLDRAEEAIRYATTHYRQANLQYLKMDCRALGFRDASFDAVTSFEVFEHLPPDDTAWYLQEIVRVLKHGGIAVISTPNGTVEAATFADIKGFNPFHLNLLTPKAFRRTLRRFFPEVVLYGQRRQMPPLPSLLKRLDLFNLRLFLSNRARERMLEAMGGNAAVPALRDVVI
ncbi:MAG: methyltransferase domain-containing protein, partial [Candidatus Rokubacteria bacterium]|nr:methyltransferase domain-containing protein [Candidatus Rokubacteria bacterium]